MDRQYLTVLEDQMVDALIKVLSINTVKTPALTGMPFGKGNADCLQYVLDLAKSMGFDTYNCDNYAGHVEFGKGEQIVGVLGHLDVVPITEGWDTPPFIGTTINGKIYGRGASDDKGPMIACLYALKALKDSGFVPNKKIRLIFGCDEESGMDCIKYYKTKMPLPDIAFSPDGDFPVINIEKGIYVMYLDVGKLPNQVLEITAGTRVNVVPDNCNALLSLTVDEQKIIDSGVGYKKTDKGYELTTTGVSCHSANPHLGDNAAWKMFKILAKIFDTHEVLNFVANKMCGDVFCKTWGFGLEDEQSGKITSNVGVVSTKEGHLKIKLDIRYPVTFSDAFIEECVIKNSIKSLTIEEKHIKKPLYVDPDSFLVKTLLNIYNSEMKTNAKPIAIGGGTYSRVLPCCVAFGPAFPDEKTAIHEKNEYIDINNLKKMAYMYALAIKTLSK